MIKYLLYVLRWLLILPCIVISGKIVEIIKETLCATCEEAIIGVYFLYYTLLFFFCVGIFKYSAKIAPAYKITSAKIAAIIYDVFLVTTTTYAICDYGKFSFSLLFNTIIPEIIIVGTTLLVVITYKKKDLEKLCEI